MVGRAHHGDTFPHHGVLSPPRRQHGGAMGIPWTPRSFEFTMEGPRLRHGDTIVLRAHHGGTMVLPRCPHGDTMELLVHHGGTVVTLWRHHGA